MNMNLKIVDVIIIVYFFLKCHADVFYLLSTLLHHTLHDICSTHLAFSTRLHTSTHTYYIHDMYVHTHVTCNMCTSSYMRSKESVLCVKHVMYP